jgi:RIO kinase 1
MEFVTDRHGNPAPRLGDVQLEPAAAVHVFEQLIREVIRMLSAGVVHGDLSVFNVLMSADGPVIIDFPQAINAAKNQRASRFLERDVDNLQRFRARCVPNSPIVPLAQEMWQLFERGELTPDTKLTGRFRAPERRVSTEEVSSLIADAARSARPQPQRGPAPAPRRIGAAPQRAGSVPQRSNPTQRTPPAPPRNNPEQRVGVPQRSDASGRAAPALALDARQSPAAADAPQRSQRPRRRRRRRRGNGPASPVGPGTAP